MSEILSRIKVVEDAKAKLMQDAEDKVMQEELEKEEIISQIQSYKEEIQDLITLANKVEENNFKLSKPYGRSFIADSISHSLGFCSNKEYRHSGSITHLGINGGGWCGEWHFRTNGTDFFSVQTDKRLAYEKDRPFREISTDVKLEHLRQFVKSYAKFKADFLEYVDSLGK